MATKKKDCACGPDTVCFKHGGLQLAKKMQFNKPKGEK
jgi:hypothetical protein